MILGVAIPLVLGFLHLLTGFACALTLFAVAGFAFAIRARGAAPDRSPRTLRSFESRIATGLPLLAATATAWPALVRPLLQGDSLLYHLPNAAAWVDAHSLWTTTTRYWWYPGASELFAAGIFAVAGPLALGFAGVAASLLLGFRLTQWGIGLGTRPWVAGALAAFALSSFTLAEQAGSLENDVWLAAFLIEALCAKRNGIRLVRASAMTALIKVTGPLYAAIALVVRRTTPRAVALASFPFLAWVVRDATLWPTAIIPPASSGYPNVAATTILFHGVAGFEMLAVALGKDGPATLSLFLAALAGIVLTRDRRLRISALVALAIFVVHPFGYNNEQPQLATGASLRYAAPLLALGAVFLNIFVVRLDSAAAFELAPSRIVGVAALALAAAGISRLVGLYHADAMTANTLGIVVLVAFVFVIPWRSFDLRSAAVFATGMALVVYAVVLAGTHPLDYYERWLAPGPRHSTFFHWLAHARPASVVSDGLSAGAIVAVSPSTRAADVDVADPCGEARRLTALLVISTGVMNPARDREQRLALARTCGRIVFDDGLTIVVSPQPLR